MSKNTLNSIEWLQEQILEHIEWKAPTEKRVIMKKIEKAKEMHQSEIEEAFYSGNQIPANWEYDSTIYYEDKFKK
jgi:hypothetical protein